MQKNLTIGVAAILGLLLIANGVFMTVSPEPWYWMVRFFCMCALFSY